jgi:dipeptidyl aminopeptidase/acylaminoacyl peptidase
VNVATGEMSPFTGVAGTFPQFSPAGDSVLTILGSNAAVTEPGKQSRNLTQAIDRGIARATWMPDGKSLLVGGNDSERVSMWIQPLDGPATKIDVGDLSANSSYYVDWTVSKDGAIAFTATSPLRPAELYFVTKPGAAPKALTHVNAAIAELPLGKTDTVEWTNDKFTENGMLTYPPNFDASKKYPLVLLIHGGPRAASMRTFSPAAQLLAAQGWLVFQPNYRGSDNLGGQYQGAIRNDAGEGPGRDVIAGIESLKKRGFVDDTRMAVSGWSYGGYMTTWMLGHYDIWKAAVTGASVTNQIDQYDLSDGAGAGRGNNSPWVSPDAMERMRQQSPITNASKIKAPTLILHNVGDYRVTITQSYELYHALIDNGVTTQFIAYPISGHNAADPVHQRDVQRRWIGWFEKYLR